jgi:hypothetical protein
LLEQTNNSARCEIRKGKKSIASEKKIFSRQTEGENSFRLAPFIVSGCNLHDNSISHSLGNSTLIWLLVSLLLLLQLGLKTRAEIWLKEILHAGKTDLINEKVIE